MRTPAISFQTRRQQGGYALLALLLVATLMAIFAAAAAPSIAFQIRRDREEELIHRGAQYSRAIRIYTRKVGRYPLRIEDLENTGGLHYLRRRYRDPISGKDFKLLHITDLRPFGIGGFAPPPVAGAAGSNQTSTDPAHPSGVSTVQPAGQEAEAAASADPGSGDSAPAEPENDAGTGVVVGVVSRSSEQTIRVFEKKNHYKDWLFFYDPAHDPGFPLQGPTPLARPVKPLQPQQPDTQ